ncbi:aminoglycoside phosphotransferase family protein [Cupriavidus respiraculi]|uniref:N-acetylmuramate/N-acetylglucosamine kinase n=1 Tax=Cupriavidus respiraculi TaxID=195930 RepID=A0ABN7YPD3_9BURK|nr:phosphotransferase [Cupriavidus respiraculi]CAG9174659.1 N-acetylmuramate/N-acetylglucosamine kinase [Cupriavidus respiraculi]
MAALLEDPRLDQLKAWASGLGPDWSVDPDSCAPASADASFRRYFRLRTANPAYPTVIAMDAPPAHEDCRPFIHVAELFGAAGVTVPRVLAQDLTQGFLLLTDLGNTTYLSRLDAASARQLYGDAAAALVHIQAASRPGVLPAYDRALLQRELDLFPQWYVGRHLGATLTDAQQADLAEVMAALLDNAVAQPQVYVHRDYHSRNLMVLSDDGNPGILDFQDAVMGPVTYDAVSLWRDAYIEWEEEEQLDWLIRYWERARKAGLPVTADFGDFYRDFEWMGLQRHLKVLGIFARLYHRDGKDGYLANLPLVMKYTRAVAGRYGELRKLIRLLDALEGVERPAGYTF